MISPKRAKFFGLGLIPGPTLIALPLFLVSTGCEEERNVGSKPKDTFIVGRRTQEIKNARTEVQKGGANVVTPKIVAKDPITLQGNAYVSIIGQTSILSIQHALDLYHAMNDRYPKDLDEFMTDIIKANNIALPLLPFYQKYGYDEKEHKLVILEYPEEKDKPLPQ
jgi:hypothetical protein